MRLWDSVKAAASGVEDDGSYDSPNSAENSAARRTTAFDVTGKDLGLADDWGDRPFGVIMEMWGPRGLMTLTAYANGDASLLHQNGSGIIGRQSHVHVVNQAKKLVALSADYRQFLSPAVSISPPAPESVRVYFLTGALLSTELAAADIRSDDSSWLPFTEVADELISELSQYLLGDIVPAGPPRPIEFLRALAMVAVIGGMTYAAWLIPIAWIRWPVVAVGLFFTAAASFVFYAMLAGSPDGPDEADATDVR